MAKKVVVLTGSPRINGNTNLLTDSFVEGAKESGNEITSFNTAHL